MWIEPYDGRQVEQLDDVHAPLSGFDVGDERLVTPERGRDVDLRHPGSLAVADEELGQALLAD